MVLPIVQGKTRGGKPIVTRLCNACVLVEVSDRLLGIAESSTIYVNSDLVTLSTHVREQVHHRRYNRPNIRHYHEH